jgi:hypothetical protein
MLFASIKDLGVNKTLNAIVSHVNSKREQPALFAE